MVDFFFCLIFHHQSKNTLTKKQSETPTGPVSMLKDGGLAIAVHAKPGAKQNAVTGWGFFHQI